MIDWYSKDEPPPKLNSEVIMCFLPTKEKWFAEYRDGQNGIGFYHKLWRPIELRATYWAYVNYPDAPREAAPLAE
jgi:hypothetical protein